MLTATRSNPASPMTIPTTNRSGLPTRSTRLDFWTEKDGAILNDQIRVDENKLIAKSNWTAKDKAVVCQDNTVYTFGQSEIGREVEGQAKSFRANWIDAQIKMIASDTDLEFKDTKEGFFAIRTHPDLRLTPDL